MTMGIASVVGRNRFVAPSSSPTGTMPAASPSGAIKRLRPTSGTVRAIWAALTMIALATFAATPACAQTLDKVRFATNWVAEAEHGGFYQALADGTYARYGLDVTIVPGGPNVNNRILLPAGTIDLV